MYFIDPFLFSVFKKVLTKRSVEEKEEPLIIEGIVAEDLVRKFENAGIGGICIEDKTFPKENSLFKDGKQVMISTKDFVAKLIAAKNESEGGLSLFRAHKGLPKYKPLIKTPYFMINNIEITAFLERIKSIPVLDLRSPGEYKSGHITGAVNMPLFNDEERAKVGTKYKQVSKDAAMLLGLDIVGPKMSGMVRKA